MPDHKKNLSYLIADDDDDYALIIKRAFQDAGIEHPLHRVADGVALLEYLRDTQNRVPPKWPGVILLDLNMPKKSGLEALRDIRADQALRRIPVIICTMSTETRDITRSYEAGANSYLTKPFGIKETIEALRSIDNYWFNVISLPPAPVQ